MRNLKIEMEELKKSPCFLPKEKEKANSGLEGDKPTFSNIASLAVASIQEGERPSIGLEGTLSDSLTQETVDLQAPQQKIKRNRVSKKAKLSRTVSISGTSSSTVLAKRSPPKGTTDRGAAVSTKTGINTVPLITTGAEDDEKLKDCSTISQKKATPQGLRGNRRHCIVVRGMPESTTDTPKLRIQGDRKQFTMYLKSLLKDEEEVEVLKAFRMGRIGESNDAQRQPRPLKVVLRSEVEAQLLLSRKPILRYSHPTVFFQQDFSPAERAKWRLLKVELQRRCELGDSNLRILNGEIVHAQRSLLWRKPITISA